MNDVSLLLCAGALLVGCEAQAPAPAPKVEQVAAPVLVRGQAPVAPFVRQQLGRGDAQATVVYVGATWCEPCRYFHDALLAGELDAELSGVRFVEYDLDADKPALRQAGYRSRMIPLFALPEAEGHASGQQIEGSIKGPRSLRDNTLPRLRQLLGR